MKVISETTDYSYCLQHAGILISEALNSGNDTDKLDFITDAISYLALAGVKIESET